MDKNTIVIGIDHGWSQMKTAGSVFTSGVREITTEPALFDNVVQYKGKYYKVGGNRLEVKEDKVSDDSFYILTLAAVAKELELRGKRNAYVLIAAGLPIGRFGAEKQGFIDYLKREREVSFRFEKKQYRITVERVSVYPQCYGAVADRIKDFSQKELVADIGSWTIDMVPVIGHSPDESLCVTVPEGIITCMRRINEQSVRLLNGQIDESAIQEVMMKGSNDFLETEYLEIVKKEIAAYAKKVFRMIGEQGYNLKTTPITFVGGGAVMMKLFGELNQKNIRYIEDVKANAKGYEYLGNIYLNRVLKHFA
ncbi:MAG: ParM/StbA family protein [Clostridium sp.]|nr:ParM/StbA family protein [Clostridium sp.]